MLTLTEHEIDRLLEEDVPYIDLTTHILKLKHSTGTMEFVSREKVVVCGTEECERLAERCRVSVTYSVPTGSEVAEGETVLAVKGCVAGLLKMWKVAQNVLEYCSGIATRTRRLVRLAESVNPHAKVVTTRKSFPLSKKLCIKAVVAGGALPHRLGLSETVLVFSQHAVFAGGMERVLQNLHRLKREVPEKKFAVEVESAEDALKCLRAGADIVQIDKVSAGEVKKVVDFRNANCRGAVVAVAGGITEENIKEYAQTGVDVIVTSYPYYGKPADIKVKVEKC